VKELQVTSEVLEETRARAGMASWTFWFDLYQQRVTVAVHLDGYNALSIAGRFSFVPELFSGPAPEPGFSGFEGLIQGFGADISDHKDFAGGSVLNHGGHQALLIEF